MAEPHDRREAQRWCGGVGGTAARLGGGEQRDLGIGARQHDDVAWRLRQVHRRRAVGDGAGFGGEEVH